MFYLLCDHANFKIPNQHNRRRAGVILALLMAILPLPSTSAHADTVNSAEKPVTYTLGPSDQVRVTVISWRPSRAEIYEWEAINGEYTVGANGKVAIPLVGRITAVGKTTEELGELISGRLQKRIGMVERPDASVEIATYRPIYVTGDVEKPGAYSYRPGMNVMQAISVASGFVRDARVTGMRPEREIIESASQLKILNIDRYALLVKKARLSAEVMRAREIAFPEEALLARSDPKVKALMSREAARFNARQKSFLTEIKELKNLQTQFAAEVASLRAEIENHNVQIELVGEEVKQINKLHERGLVSLKRSMDLRRSAAQIKGDKLRMQRNLMKAQQGVTQTQVKIIQLKNKRASEVTKELSEVELALKQNEVRSGQLTGLIRDSMFITPYVASERTKLTKSATYKVLRRVKGGTKLIEANETTLVKPDDTVQVRVSIGDFESDLQKTSDAKEYRGSSLATLRRE